MSTEDIARVIVYTAVILPSLIFSATYLACFFFIKRTVESWHLLIFTGVVGWVATEILLAQIGWWEFSLTRFLIAIGAAAVLLVHRVYLLYSNLVIPLARRRLVERRRRRANALD